MTGGNIDIRIARHIVALAKHLSFTHASEELGISQSALSRSIQRFENLANLRLFDRTRGGVHLTVVGKAIEKRAQALVQDANEFERVIQQSAEGLQDSVAFGVGHLPAKAMLPQVMAEALTESPTLHVRVFVRTSEALLSMLLLDEIEFLVCAERLVPTEAPVRRYLLGTFPMDQLVRPGHPLLQSGNRRPPHDFPWIITKQVGEARPPENDRLSHLRQKPQMEIEDMDCLSRITQESDAIWVTSRATASRELQSGRLHRLSSSGMSGDASIRMMMYSRSDRSLSPAALRLRDKFRLTGKSSATRPAGEALVTVADAGTSCPMG